MKQYYRNRFVRVGLVLVALGTISIGVLPILRGSYFYRNYWGGLVYAPATIVGGVLLFWVGLFGWKRFRQVSENSKARARSKENRQHRDQSPLDDFSKPWTGG